MSTSATQPGTTTRTGRSGKGLGIAAAALAIVIAAGFVFAINQGNEVTGSGVNELSGPAEIAAARHAERVRLLGAAALAATRPDGAAELARLNELAAQVQAESHPASNIEKTKMELAAQAAVRPAGSAELARLNELAAQVQAESHPAFNIEKAKMELAGQLAAANEYPGISPEKTRMESAVLRNGFVINKLDGQTYVPSIVLPSVATSYWSEGNLDLRRAQAKAQQPTELNQPEWDNRMP
jgi:hypothetical protein